MQSILRRHDRAQYSGTSKNEDTAEGSRSEGKQLLSSRNPAQKSLVVVLEVNQGDEYNGEPDIYSPWHATIRADA